MEEQNFVGLSEQESEQMFDAIARKSMGLSGDEFLKNWNAGVYDGKNWDDVPGLVETGMALPFTSKPRRTMQEVTGEDRWGE